MPDLIVRFICEACRTVPAADAIDSTDGRPFRLCVACVARLQSFSLRPLEWFNLATLHGPFEAMLHDDFYEDDGRAAQPKRPLVEGQRFPAPALDDLRDDLERVVDLAMTRWWLKSDVVDALRAHPAEEVFSAIKRRVDLGVRAIEGRALEIAARVVGPLAADWVRQRWMARSPETWFSLVEATSACLPRDEGLKRVFADLDEASDDGLIDRALALTSFRDGSVLDWLESHVREPLTESWGNLAAASQMSWPRVAVWLERGRPLSLVALDALLAIVQPKTPRLQELRPELVEPPTCTALTHALNAYAVRDPVLRVSRATKAILATWR